MLNIVFEDKWILVLDKPSGMVVNRSETMGGGTLQDELSTYFNLGESLGIGNRAGIVHRLDKETSGLLIVAKTNKAYQDLQSQFKKRQVEKKYIALVHGDLGDDEGIVEKPIVRIKSFGKFGIAKREDFGQRYAKTIYKVANRYELGMDFFDKIDVLGLSKNRLRYLKVNAKNYCLLDVFPKTGRTHQIRVHLKSIGHPIVSDLIYGPAKLLKLDFMWCPRLFLHAASLEFMHPNTDKKIKFESDLPKELKDAIVNL